MENEILESMCPNILENLFEYFRFNEKKIHFFLQYAQIFLQYNTTSREMKKKTGFVLLQKIKTRRGHQSMIYNCLPLIFLNCDLEILSKNKRPADRSIVSGGTCCNEIKIWNSFYFIKRAFFICKRKNKIKLPETLLAVYYHQ